MDHLSPLLEACGSLVLRALVAYSSLILLCPLVSVYQEHKLWKHPSVQSLTPVGMLKVYIFNVIWMGLTLVDSLDTLLLMGMEREAAEEDRPRTPVRRSCQESCGA